MAGHMKKVGDKKYKFWVSAGFGAGKKRLRYTKTITAKDDQAAEQRLSSLWKNGVRRMPKSWRQKLYTAITTCWIREYCRPWCFSSNSLTPNSFTLMAG